MISWFCLMQRVTSLIYWPKFIFIRYVTPALPDLSQHILHTWKSLLFRAHIWYMFSRCCSAMLPRIWKGVSSYIGQHLANGLIHPTHLRHHRSSLRGRRLEVVGERENGRARETRVSRVSPSRAPVFSCAHYFQAPATQAITEALWG